jgi:hypothetical protein
LIEPEEAEAAEKVVAMRADAPEFISERRPRYVNDLRMSQVRWDDLASNREWRTALHLRGLPKIMCEPGVLRSVLQSQGLLDKVESLRVLPTKGKQLCNVLLNAKSVADVPMLAKFFHGRTFGGSMPVAVSFAARPARQSEGKKTAAAADGGCLPRPQRSSSIGLSQPWRVGVNGFSLPKNRLDFNSLDHPAYAASTLSSTPRWSSSSDVASDEVQTVFGLSPPPGLEMMEASPLPLELQPPGLESCR